jgi:NSS family neurotransmitter:Na+ symporter
MSGKNEFATKIGLIAATVGSAIGLGNVWRFPAETQENGGAAFLLLYMVCLFVLGIPVMLGEFAMGREGRSDASGVYRRLAPGTRWWWVGALAVVAPYLITIYYMVVAGWTLSYFIHSITGTLYAVAPGETPTEHFAAVMDTSLYGVWQPIAATVAIIVINIVILLRGVQKGIERLSNVLMPLLFVILVVLMVVSLSLPGASEGVKFFLSPDFSRITPSVLINALGQAFFSLSLGMGILVTYSAYYPDDARLPRTSVIVVLLSLLVAVMMGLVIFPAVTSFGLQNESLEGATLIFVTLPEVFSRMPCSQLWSILFFLLLLVATITSTVSLGEVGVAYVKEHFGVSRRRAVLTVLCPLLVLSPVCSLSIGAWSDITVCGMTMFDGLDTLTTNLLLPIVSIGTCLFVGWFGPRRLLKHQLTNRDTHPSAWVRPVAFMLRYVAPLLIALILISRYI